MVDATAATWAALEPQVTVNSVTIASPPVVTFTVKDAFGKPVVGLANTTKSSTATVASYPNIAFSLAKLVPGTSGSPSKWVSYIITTVPTTTAAAAPTRPSTDNTGTLVDNGDGSYKYTFYRDVTAIKSQVDAMTVTGANNKADLGDLTYNANLTHRLTIAIYGNAPGTGTNTPTGAASNFVAVPMKAPVNIAYDFIPATGKAATATDAGRNIVSNTKCNECHRVLGGIPGLSGDADAAAFHGSNRNNADYCVVCHTDQRRYGRTDSTVASTNGAKRTFSGSTYVIDGRTLGNFPNYIHKVHAGELLVNRGYNYGGLDFVETTYPQDIRNCQKCHDGSASSTAKTTQGDNWKNVPNRLACGSCHDGINFATGTGVTMRDAAAGLTTSAFAHPAGAQPDDSLCALCHKPDAIDVYHLPVTPPNSGNALLAGGTNANTNSAWIASGGSVNRLPAGAIKVTYDVKSVQRTTAKNPSITFRMLQNGTAVPLNTYATATPNPATGDKEIWDNFMGSPSVYFVWSQPQDGNTAPADFNVSASGWLKTIWSSGKAGISATAAAATLTGPDANGYYTATLTGVIVPDGALMLSGGLGYSYNVTSTLPLTQTNVAGYPTAVPTRTTPIVGGEAFRTGGLIVIAPNVQKVAAGYTGRRQIVEDARCNACHQELGVFTEDAFHGGQRNDGSTCAWCHRPNQTSSGWSADSTAFVHAIHGSAKRTVPYVWHATTAAGFSEVTYPGVLNDCETCHLPGTYDFSGIGTPTSFASGTAQTSPAAVGATDGIDKRLYRTVGTGTFAAPAAGAVNTLSPYIQTGVAYGSGYSVATATGVATEAAGTTLVTSPTVAVCSACHDSADAISHFKINGGAFYQARSTAISGTNETCLVCHATGRIGDIKVMHYKKQ